MTDLKGVLAPALFARAGFLAGGGPALCRPLRRQGDPGPAPEAEEGADV